MKESQWPGSRSRGRGGDRRRTANLKKGRNSIKFTKSEGFAELDRVDIVRKASSVLSMGAFDRSSFATYDSLNDAVVLGASANAANPSKLNSDTRFVSVTCYSSADLVNWKFEGNVIDSADKGSSGTSRPRFRT